MITVLAEMIDEQRIALFADGPVEALAFAAKQLQQMTPLLKPSDPKGALICALTWPAVVQLSAIYGDNFKTGPKLGAWISQQITARTSAPAFNLVTPEGLTPRPYQIEGAQVIARTGRGMIFDEPRTGKTITTILGLLQWAERVDFRGHADVDAAKSPFLVIAPASVVDPWVEAWQAWAPWLRTVAWRGPKRVELLGTADVYVTSYDTALRDARDTTNKSPLMKLAPKAVVVDECHYIKNPTGKKTGAVRRLGQRAQAFVALSGTPIEHHPADLWPTLTCLAPDAWPARERWVNRYCTSVPAEYGETILGLNPGAEPEFRLTYLGQHRRVTRDDVMADLPPKVYSVRTVELPNEYRKAYDAFEEDMIASLPDGQELSVMDALSQLTMLSRLSSSAFDVEVTFETTDDGVEKRHVHTTLKAPSWKVDALLEILAEREGDPTLAFTVSADLCRLAGQAAAGAGYRVGYVIGGQSAKDRTDTVARFQAGQLDVLCCTTSAGGTGLTMSAAGTLVFLERPWRLVESIQAEDRAEGDPNKKRGTEVIDIVAANTVDTRRRAALRAKAGQLSDLLQDPRIVAELLGGTNPKRKAA